MLQNQMTPFLDRTIPLVQDSPDEAAPQSLLLVRSHTTFKDNVQGAGPTPSKDANVRFKSKILMERKS